MKKLACLLWIILIIGMVYVPDPSKKKNSEEPENETPPVYVEPSIQANEYFFPSTLNKNSKQITEFTYIDENLTDEYKIYSAYYSETYDTIYIAYDLVDTPVQTLKAKDLAEIEKHAITYFTSDSTRSEDTKYLKAVRIYPDRLASSCRKGRDDNAANQINGCADYGGKQATIDLNNTKSMDDFYNEKRVPAGSSGYYIYQPTRDTFAHEYGHVSTFYHMVYKNDENYEDYLKLRLGNYYSTVYPSGLPDSYSSGSSYNIQPEEILADDFVELFYNRTTKDLNDTSEYTFEYGDLRNSLKNFVPENIQFLDKNQTLKEKVKTYYTNNFLNYSNKKTYTQPKIISSSNRTISYYESYSKISNTSNLKTINSKIDVNLIAVGEVTISNVKYYRVILSNTFYCPGLVCDMKDVGEKMGYVVASAFTNNNSLKLYKTKDDNQNSLFPIQNNDSNKLYLFPSYPCSYVLATSSSGTLVTMYDYLNSALPNHTYQINKGFLVLLS